MAAMAAPAGAVQQDPGAEHTIYVSNLFEKIKQDDLKKCMHAIFGQFGPILEVVSRRTYRLRGQAWVVFQRAEDAQRAMQLMSGFPFFNKPIRIALAKTKSDAVAKQDGTFSEDTKASRQHKTKAAAQDHLEKTKQREVVAPGAGARARAAISLPNKTLFIENLPDSANEAMLGLLFQQFTGFKEVRMVPQRPGIAFIEYEDEVQSSVAMQGLQEFKLANDRPMKITFAKV